VLNGFLEFLGILGFCHNPLCQTSNYKPHVLWTMTEKHQEACTPTPTGYPIPFELSQFRGSFFRPATSAIARPTTKRSTRSSRQRLFDVAGQRSQARESLQRRLHSPFLLSVREF